MIFHYVSMDCVGWLWVAGLCSMLVWACTTSGMGRKVLNDLERVSPTLLEMGCWETLCVYGLFSRYFPFFPYLWQDRRTQKKKKERPLALLWS